MARRTLLLSSVLLALVLMPIRARAAGFILGESKAELKLKYGVTVQDHGTGRVTVVFTLVDEGRLKPLDEVQFVIPGKEKNADGGRWMDLVVSIGMTDAGDGRRVGRVHLLKELAERAEIQLNTHTMDGKMDPLTRLHHVIPVAKHLKDAPAAGAKPAAAAPALDPPTAPAPPATERARD
jgi:hypothetical protein